MTLNPEQQKLIDEMVKSGLFDSPDQVVDTALRLLDERNKQLEALRKDVQVGIDQLDRGEYTEYTGENLHELFDAIKQRGRERLASRNPARPD